MTKKIIAVLCIIMLSLALSSCMELSVEEMLTAPALTADQSSIITALESRFEKFTLLYPSSGERRTPIQFIDLDGDNVYEATVFFTHPVEDVDTAQLAVLEKLDGVWNVVSVISGAGTKVDGINVFRITGSSRRTMLVEWSASSEERLLTAYGYKDGEIIVEYEDFCSGLVVSDLDADGYSEFTYIKRAGAAEPFEITAVEINAEGYRVYGHHTLNDNVMTCMSFLGGKLGDGRAAVFVDENLGNDYKFTDVFLLEDEALVKLYVSAEDKKKTLESLSMRSASSLPPTALFSGETLVPSIVAPRDDILQPEAWTYWYSLRGETVEYSLASYTESGYMLALVVPEDWLGYATVARSESEPRLIEVTDSRDGRVILRLKILTLGESDETYALKGYRILRQSGSYRYYAWADLPEEEFNFIKSNFVILY